VLRTYEIFILLLCRLITILRRRYLRRSRRRRYLEHLERLCHSWRRWEENECRRWVKLEKIGILIQ
jgi:hypothetical protein